jgi:hypothetical protein
MDSPYRNRLFLLYSSMSVNRMLHSHHSS